MSSFRKEIRHKVKKHLRSIESDSTHIIDALKGIANEAKLEGEYLLGLRNKAEFLKQSGITRVNVEKAASICSELKGRLLVLTGAYSALRFKSLAIVIRCIFYRFQRLVDDQFKLR